MRTPSLTICTLSLFLATHANSQGTAFRNLDFEQANVAPTPVGGYGGQVDPALAFPSWTVSSVNLGTVTNYGPLIYYNNMALDSPEIALMGPYSPNGLNISPLQGSYSVMLQYSAYFKVSPCLSQIGLVPAGANSINFLTDTKTFWGSVNLNNLGVPLVQVGNRLWGDVTAFSGQETKLTFQSLSYNMYIDDIQFSSIAVPEPQGLCVLTTGILLCRNRLLRGCRRS